MANSNATSVGAVSFDLGLNTNGLTQAINEAARNASTQLSDAFRTALTGCENSINGIGNSLTQMTSGFQNNVNQMSQSMTDTFRNASTQIASDMQNNMAQMSQNMTDTFRNTSAQIAGDVQNSMSQMSQNISDSMRTAEQDAENLGKKSEKVSKSMGKSFLSNAANIKSAFDMVIGSVRKLMSECSQMMTVYQTQIEAEARLAATMRNATSASDEQIQSVKDLASSLQELGVVGDEVQLAGAQELATYVENVDSIKTMLPVLDNMIAQQYGFSASTDSAVTIATMLGKVLQGQTSALSRYGYSFDEAQEKLLKYGTEEQRVATLAEVVSESVSGVNESLADTPTGKVKQLSNDFGDLKETLGKFITDIISPLVKQLDVIVKKLNEVFTTASEGINNLLGIENSVDVGSAIVGIMGDVEEEISDIVEDTQEDIQDSIDDTVEAYKKAQGQLAGFDNLNVLSMPDEDNDSDNSKDDNKEVEKNDDIAESAELAKSSVDDLNQSVSSVKFDGIKKQLQELMKSFEPLTSAVKRNVQAAVDNAQKGIEKYLDKYGDKISEYSDRIKGHLENTATQTANGITNLLNEAAASQERCSDELSTGYADLMGGTSIFALSFADVFAGGLDIVSKNFEDWTVDNSDTIGDFFDGLNGNAANAMSTFGGILEDIGTTLTTWWDEKGSQAFDGFIGTLFDIGDFLMELWNDYVTPFIDYLIDSVGDFWDNHLSKLWNNILEFASSLMDCISALWNNWFRPLWDKLLRGPITGIMGALKSIWDAVLDVFGVIVDVVRGIIRSLQGVLDFITGIFTGDIEKCVKGLAEFIHGICIIIWGVIKGAINLVIDALNAVWSAFYGMLKEIVDGIGAFVGKIGDLLGKDWGFTLPDEVPRIPRLAQGGLVKAPTIAMVGDNKNAYNDPEVISPLSKLQGMLDSENSDDTEILQQILMYLKMLCDFNKNGGGNIEITAKCDEDVLFKSTVKKNNAYKRRHGGKSAYA